MFATATLHERASRRRGGGAGDAVLHLHDRAYVFEPGGATGDFRTHVGDAGHGADGGMVEVTTGCVAGQQVVANALALQNTADQ